MRQTTLLLLQAPLLAIGVDASSGSTFAQGTNYITAWEASGPSVNGESGSHGIADSGRYSIFESNARGLAPLNLMSYRLVFRYDLATGERVLVTPDATGSGPADGHSYHPDISADGRYAVWYSTATNLVSPGTNTATHVYLRDLTTNTTLRLDAGAPPLGSTIVSSLATITPDARYVLYRTNAAYDPVDTNGFEDVYRYERATGNHELVSVTASGVVGDLGSLVASISDDGRFVAFASRARNLVPGDTNNQTDTFLKDMNTGALNRVSITAGGVEANSTCNLPTISGDASAIVFYSRADNLVPNDTNQTEDVFRWSRATGGLEMVSVSSSGAQGTEWSLCEVGAINNDGTQIVFSSPAPNLVPGDGNGETDVFVRDVVLGTTTRVSLDFNGGELAGQSQFGKMSGDGHKISFLSRASDVVPGVVILPAFSPYVPYVVDRLSLGVAGETSCAAAPNSTLSAGAIGLSGSTLVAANQLTATAAQLPPSAFGIFIVSDAVDFVANPGGSAGNLCLGGTIGRFNGAGQIQQSTAAGRISLPIDLMRLPLGGAFVAAAPGETWHFQAWTRDTLQGVPTSNFTNAVSVELR